MAQGSLDQHQDSEGSNFGFGEAAGVKYRGQVWTAGVTGKLGSIGFSRDLPSKDIKVYIDTVAAGVPAHAVGSELYSFTIPQASCANGYAVYDLPIPLAGIVAGTQYCFYLAPFTGGVYSDDYHDCHGVIAVGGGQFKFESGAFTAEDLTFHYAVYVIPQKNINQNNLRPRAFAPGIAR